MNDVDAFDRSVQQAWTRFRSALADHIDEMPIGGSLVLHCLPSAAHAEVPCVELYAWDIDLVRCEALTVEYLPDDCPSYALGSEHVAVFDRWAFSPPVVSAHDAEAVPSDVPSNWFLDRPRSHADQLAAAAVGVLREVWDVPHPAFVRPESPERLDVAALVERIHEPPHAPADPFVAVRTGGADHRREVVENTLHRLLGFVPEADEDGDFPFRLGPAFLYLCPTYDAPFVQILAPIATGVRDPQRAAVVIADVNRRWPHVKVLLDQDRVVATIDVPVVPCVPQQIVDMLALMERFVGEAAENLVAKLGAVPYLDRLGEPSVPSPGSTRLPPLLCALAEDVWARGADIDVEEVLGHCGHDRTVLSSFLEVARDCEAAALDRALPEDDPRAAAAAGLDARIWRVTANLLISAHRHLVARNETTSPSDDAGSRGAQLELFGSPDPLGTLDLFGSEDTLFD